MSLSDEVSFSTWQRVHLVHWHSSTTEEGVKELSRRHQELWKKLKAPIAVIHVIGAKSAPPSTATRKLLADFLRTESESIAINAAVIEGQGFHSAAVRAVTSGIALLSRMSFPHEVHSNFDTCLTSVARCLKLNDGSKKILTDFVNNSFHTPRVVR